MMPRPIAILTDFGYTDAYVGVMKGVIHSRLPEARLFDLTHGVPPQAVRVGALQLLSAALYCPPDCVFLAVVDPGVGSDRRPVCLRSGGRFFVGPDNGLLWPAAAALGEPEAWVLDRPEHWLPTPGATFHGRDIFAPIAAALAGGESPEILGSPISDPARLDIPAPAREGSLLRGEILLVDGYGNAVTNLRPADLGNPAPFTRTFRAESTELRGPAPFYAAVAAGAPLVVVGSLGYYEIAINGGHAARELGLQEGSPVTVEG